MKKIAAVCLGFTLLMGTTSLFGFEPQGTTTKTKKTKKSKRTKNTPNHTEKKS